MEIDKIHKKIKSTLNFIDKHASTLTFSEVMSLEECFANKKLKHPAIYKIEINQQAFCHLEGTWKEQFIELWDTKESKNNFSPNYGKNNLDQCQGVASDGWVILYVGKAKNLRDRIRFHHIGKFATRKKGLKLAERDIYEEEHFRVSFAELPSENYDVIAPRFEVFWREKLKPIVGG
ncbi:conserved hypothetical protein [Vibrio jasicida]|uniref:hypothetical protein n=1 Tax=Vibrio jasicida TaxID=766224 RepID=UPI002894EADF|nr:conserved hypothetical protein [Vibrio jasicida]